MFRPRGPSWSWCGGCRCCCQLYIWAIRWHRPDGCGEKATWKGREKMAPPDGREGKQLRREEKRWQFGREEKRWHYPTEWHHHHYPTECGDRRKDGARRNAATRRHRPPPPSYDPTERGDPTKLLSVVPPTVEFDGRYPLRLYYTLRRLPSPPKSAITVGHRASVI